MSYWKVFNPNDEGTHPELNKPIMFADVNGRSYMGIMSKIGKVYFFLAEVGTDHEFIFTSDKVKYWGPKIPAPNAKNVKNVKNEKSEKHEEITNDEGNLSSVKNGTKVEKPERVHVKKNNADEEKKILLKKLHQVRHNLEEDGWSLTNEEVPADGDPRLLFCFIPNQNNPLKSAYLPAVGRYQEDEDKFIPQGIKVKNAVIGWDELPPLDDRKWIPVQKKVFMEKDGFVLVKVTMFETNTPEPWQCQMAIARMKSGKIVVHGFPDTVRIVAWQKLPKIA